MQQFLLTFRPRKLRLDKEHYIRAKLIPPLERIFNLLGADVKSWYTTMPKIDRVGKAAGIGARELVEDFYASNRCTICAQPHDASHGRECPTVPTIGRL